jgi:hypothetical protein
MFARATRATARKGGVQQTDVRNQVHLHPSPVRKWAIAGAANLIPKELDGTIVNPVIVWLDDSRFIPINKANQEFLIDRRSEQLVNVRHAVLS